MCFACKMSQFKLPPEVTFNEKVQVFYYKTVDLTELPDYLQFARDRLRFKRWNRQINSQIGYIFNPVHRRFNQDFLINAENGKIHEKIGGNCKGYEWFEGVIGYKKEGAWSYWSLWCALEDGFSIPAL